jgi:hypothetical protein
MIEDEMTRRLLSATKRITCPNDLWSEYISGSAVLPVLKSVCKGRC